MKEVVNEVVEVFLAFLRGNIAIRPVSKLKVIDEPSLPCFNVFEL